MRTRNLFVFLFVAVVCSFWATVSPVWGDTVESFLPYNQSNVLKAVNVQGAWDAKYDGTGVIVGVVDQGVEYTHPDLKNSSFDKELSYNYGSYYNTGSDTTYGSADHYTPWWDSFYSGTSVSGDNHGTNVASCINSKGTISSGIAPGATTASLRIDLTVSSPSDKSQDQMIYNALSANNGTIQIKNCSFGVDVGYAGDSGCVSAITQGTSDGTIFVFSAGNSRYTTSYNCKDCNKKAYTSTPHSIAVAATGQKYGDSIDYNGYASFSCYGSNVFVTAPGYVVTADRTEDSSTGQLPSGKTTAGFQGYQGITSTHDGNNNSTQGTSFSAPIVSASLAVATQALNDNPVNQKTPGTIQATTRLMKHLLVQTSTKIDTSATSAETAWTTNAAGNSFSASYGFGQVDVTALANAALTTNGVTDLTLACASWGTSFTVGQTNEVTISTFESKENLDYDGLYYASSNGSSDERYAYNDGAVYTFDSVSSDSVSSDLGSYVHVKDNTGSYVPIKNNSSSALNSTITTLDASTSQTTITANFDQSIFETAGIQVQGLEEVTLTLSGIVSDNFNEMQLELTSPSGTKSILAYADTGSSKYTDTLSLYWTFTSNAFWGENPVGDWTLSIIDVDGSTASIKSIGEIVTTFYMGELKTAQVLQYNAGDATDLGTEWKLDGTNYDGVVLNTGDNKSPTHSEKVTISANSSFNIDSNYTLEQTGAMTLENNPNITIKGGGTLKLDLDTTGFNTSDVGTISLSSSELEFYTTSARTLTFSTTGNGTITGNGGLVFRGDGTSNSSYDFRASNLSNLSSYGNYMVIDNATVQVNNNTVLDNGEYYIETEVRNGAQLYVTNDSTNDTVLNTCVYIAGTGVGDSKGALRLAGNLNGYVFLPDNATIGFDSSNTVSSIVAPYTNTTSTLTIQSNESNVGGTFNYALVDESSYSYAYGVMNVDIKSGTHIFSGYMVYTGTTTVEENAKMILSGDNSNLGDSQAVTVDGTLEFSDYSGTTDMQLNNLSGSGTITGTNQDLTLDSNVDNPGIFDGTINVGTGEITKTGNGTLKIYSKSDDYSNLTASSVIVEAGRLDLKGYYQGNVNVEANAQLSPGNSVGRLTVKGNITLEKSSQLVLEIGGKNSDDNDQLDISGSLFVDPEASIILTPSEDSTLLANETFQTYIKANNVSEDWSKFFKSVAFSNLQFSVADGKLSISGTYLGASGVPEPSTWALLILGCAGLMWYRRKK